MAHRTIALTTAPMEPCSRGDKMRAKIEYSVSVEDGKARMGGLGM